MADTGEFNDMVWLKASLVPTAWAVECPSCGAKIEIEVEDDDAGVFHGKDEDQFPICRECGVGVEVVGARLVETEAAPWRVPHG